MISVAKEGNVAVVTMDDGKANALGTQTLRSLQHTFAGLHDADAVLLTGRAKIFCGGLDLGEVATLKEAALTEFITLFHDVFRAVFAFNRPLVIAASGGAVAGGAILLCCGDVRLGGDDAGLVGVNETRLGIEFPAAALEIVRYSLEPRAAHRALVLGELFDKKTALSLGFFDELVASDTLLGRALEKTKDAAKASPRAVQETKHALRAQAMQRIDAGRAMQGFVQAWTNVDTQKRIAAALASLKKK